MEIAVFAVCSAIILAGALGVIVFRNPVHAALALVASLFGVAVLFLSMDAQFLGVVQVVVYAGAIVVLFLFVIMLLGVDRAESLRVEPIGGQRPLALAVGVGVLVLVLLFVVGIDTSSPTPPGDLPALESCIGLPVNELPPNVTSSALECEGREAASNISQVAEGVFGDYVWAFQLTGLLLTVSVVGAVVLARRPRTLEEAADVAEGTGSPV